MESRTKLGWLPIAIVLLLIVIAFPLGRLAIFMTSSHRPGSIEEKIIEIHKGETPHEISKVLLSNDVISDADNFMLTGRLIRQWRKIKVGEYKLTPSMSPLEVFDVITSGVSLARPITVREGENMYEIADDLTAKGLSSREKFLEVCRDPKFIASLNMFQVNLPTTLEGYLFPDTYYFNRALSNADIARQMVKHFFEFWTPEQEAQAQLLGLNQHGIITLASIIEKETGAAEERAIISSVFHNRLKKRMRLQSDPTTIYGMWERYKGKIHKKDLSEKNNYNTYSVSSLPEGPIGNPGKEAIQAALHPAETPYLFFVSHNDGTHQFSRTVEEHNRAVQKFQLDRKMREGKSWRDRLRKTASTNVSGSSK
ncbi:MAG: endolytic transglycosylase MltG [Bdellovibrionia bacterium]